jgi:hypothetical protein
VSTGVAVAMAALLVCVVVVVIMELTRDWDPDERAALERMETKSTPPGMGMAMATNTQRRTEPVTRRAPVEPREGWAYREPANGVVYAYSEKYGWMAEVSYVSAFGIPPLGFVYVGDEAP